MRFVPRFGHAAGAVETMGLSDDGRLAISVGVGIRIWDVETGGVLHASGRTSHGARLAALAEGGRIAITGDRDGVVRTWDAATGKQLRRGPSFVVRA